MPQPLEYSSRANPPSAVPVTDGAGSRSLRIGIFCWCAIALALILLTIAIIWPATWFGLAMAFFLIVFIQTLLAGYGLIAGCIACYFEGGQWRAIAGVILNALAICMVPVLFMLNQHTFESIISR
jgi:hypothetical protein